MRRHVLPMLLSVLLSGAGAHALSPIDGGPVHPHIELSGPIVPPPRNLRVTSNFGGRVIKLDFDCGRHASSHETFRQVAGGAWAKLGEACVEDGPERGHIFDDGVWPETQFCYRVNARNSDTQATTEPACVVADQWRSPPTLPQIALGEVRKDRVVVHVLDRSVTEAGFRLLRRVKGVGAFSVIHSLDAYLGNHTEVHYHDTEITLGTTYEYKANVYDKYGNNADTVVIEATTFPALPSAPSQVLFDDRTTSSLRVHWRGRADDVVDTYHLTFAGPGSAPPVTVTVRGTRSEYVRSGLAAGQEYCVSIAGENKSGAGPLSDATCASTHEQRTDPDDWPADFVDLGLSEPTTTPATTGSNEYEFRWSVCNNAGSEAATRIQAGASLNGSELRLDAALRDLAFGECQFFIARGNAAFGLNDIRVFARPSEIDGYRSDNVSNHVFSVNN